MIRTGVTALLIAILPTLAAAQAPGPPGPQHRPPGRAPAAVPHAPPHLGGPAVAPGRFTYRGRAVTRMHVSPFVYPAGWGYRRWVVGAILPPLFLVPAYYYADWAALGLAPPQPGFQWVRYGPDLLLVNVTTGAVVDVVYGAFY